MMLNIVGRRSRTVFVRRCRSRPRRRLGCAGRRAVLRNAFAIAAMAGVIEKLNAGAGAGAMKILGDAAIHEDSRSRLQFSNVIQIRKKFGTGCIRSTSTGLQDSRFNATGKADVCPSNSLCSLLCLGE